MALSKITRHLIKTMDVETLRTFRDDLYRNWFDGEYNTEFGMSKEREQKLMDVLILVMNELKIKEETNVSSN